MIIEKYYFKLKVVDKNETVESLEKNSGIYEFP